MRVSDEIDDYLRRLIDQTDQLTSVPFVVHPAGRSGRALVAATELQRRRGLRGVDLAGHDGMLFDAGRVSSQPFTMDGVPDALEIVFLDEQGFVTGITDMAPGEPLVAPPAAYRWAFECPAGGCERLQLGPGSRMEIDTTAR